MANSYLIIYPPGEGGGKTRLRHGATLRSKETVTATVAKNAADLGYKIASRTKVVDKLLDTTYENVGAAKKAAEDAGLNAITYQLLSAYKKKQR